MFMAKKIFFDADILPSRFAGLEAITTAIEFFNMLCSLSSDEASDTLVTKMKKKIVLDIKLVE